MSQQSNKRQGWRRTFNRATIMAVSLGMFGVAAGFPVSAAYATTHKICLQHVSPARCLSRPGVGKPARINPFGNAWIVSVVGHVKSQSRLFFSASYDAHYSGKPIVKFKNPANTNQCLQATNTQPFRLILGSCSNQNSLFVESGGWLVSVSATNLTNLHEPTPPLVIGLGNTNNGSVIVVTQGGALPFQNWTY